MRALKNLKNDNEYKRKLITNQIVFISPKKPKTFYSLDLCIGLAHIIP